MKNSFFVLLIGYFLVASCQRDNIEDTVSINEQIDPPSVENITSKSSQLIKYVYVEDVDIKSGELSLDWHEVNDLIFADFRLNGILYDSWISEQEKEIILDPSTNLIAYLYPLTDYGQRAIDHHPYVTGAMGNQEDKLRPKFLWGINSSFIPHGNPWISSFVVMKEWWDDKYYDSSKPSTHSSRQNFARTLGPAFFKENYYLKLVYEGPKVR